MAYEGASGASNLLKTFHDSAKLHWHKYTGLGFSDQTCTALHLPFIAVELQIPDFVFIAIKLQMGGSRQKLGGGHTAVVGQHPHQGIATFELNRSAVNHDGVAIYMAQIGPRGICRALCKPQAYAKHNAQETWHGGSGRNAFQCEATGKLGALAKSAGTSPVKLSKKLTISATCVSLSCLPSCNCAMMRTACGKVAAEPSWK